MILLRLILFSFVLNRFERYCPYIKHFYNAVVLQLSPKLIFMLNHNHNDLIQTLINCALTCEMCATECLQEDDVKMMAECIRLDRDCADLCNQAAILLQRGSKIGHQYLLICEEICRMCGEECKKHSTMDHCKKCAEACMQCAEACHAHHEPITQR